MKEAINSFFYVKLADRPHLLIWDEQVEIDIVMFVSKIDAHHVDYRENLLSRIDPEDHFLLLHKWVDRELNNLRTICVNTNKPIVILENLDYLITYLQVQSSEAFEQFWLQLRKMRQLETLLWIILPSKLQPNDWPKEQLKVYTTTL